MRLHPENGRPAQLGAASLARLGQTERAREWLDRAMVLDPDDAIVIYNAACTYAQLGDVDSAMEALERWSVSSAWGTETGSRLIMISMQSAQTLASSRCSRKSSNGAARSLNI